MSKITKTWEKCWLRGCLTFLLLSFGKKVVKKAVFMSFIKNVIIHVYNESLSMIVRLKKSAKLLPFAIGLCSTYKKNYFLSGKWMMVNYFFPIILLQNLQGFFSFGKKGAKIICFIRHWLLSWFAYLKKTFTCWQNYKIV